MNGLNPNCGGNRQLGPAKGANIPTLRIQADTPVPRSTGNTPVPQPSLQQDKKNVQFPAISHRRNVVGQGKPAHSTQKSFIAPRNTGHHGANGFVNRPIKPGMYDGSSLQNCVH